MQTPLNRSHLVSVTDLECITERVLADNPGMTRLTAERIVGEALKLAYTRTRYPFFRLTPSPAVYKGWRAIVLHTQAKARLAEALGMKMHRIPDEAMPTHPCAAALAQTQYAMRSAGYQPDPELWSPQDDMIPSLMPPGETEPPTDGLRTQNIYDAAVRLSAAFAAHELDVPELSAHEEGISLGRITCETASALAQQLGASAAKCRTPDQVATALHDVLAAAADHELDVVTDGDHVTMLGFLPPSAAHLLAGELRAWESSHVCLHDRAVEFPNPAQGPS